MTLSNLLGHGYLCEELPPIFTSKSLGLKANSVLKAVNNLPKMSDMNYVNFIAPKVGIYRRQFSIPHPYAQIKLSDTIVKNWNKILAEYNKSNVSISKPEIDKTGKRAIVYLDKLEKFRESCIIASSTKRYQLHLDIAKYFYSIYTHSIPWAIHTKPIAKANHKLSLWGNQIDTYIRLTQSNQTKGIPVGTDTSRIIAEVIGCEIDAAFERALTKNKVPVRGYRFVDDCKYFFDTLADAELALREYQKILTDYSLNLNDDKTVIKESPCLYDIVWKLPLNSAPLEAIKDKNQRSDLKNYFNLLIHLAQENPRDSVVKYGLRRISRLSVHSKNVEILESLLFSVALHETSILPNVLELLKKYKSQLSKNGLGEFVNTLINQNIHKGHHYEVAWALWIAKCFNITVSASLAQQILDSRDVVSTIVLLDLITSKQINGSVSTTDLITDLQTPSSLDGELWLLAYEAEIKGWLPLTNISSNQFFEILRKNKVTFYEFSKSTLVAQKPAKTPRIPIKTGSTKLAYSISSTYQSNTDNY